MSDTNFGALLTLASSVITIASRDRSVESRICENCVVTAAQAIRLLAFVRMWSKARIVSVFLITALLSPAHGGGTSGVVH